MEMNPNHPATMAAHDHWHKFTVLVMHKLGVDHVVITADDIGALGESSAITVQEQPDGIHLRIVDQETSMRLAREHGGLPS